jgi:hypothetical protein
MTWAEAPDGSIPDIYAGVVNSDGRAGSPWRFPVSAGPGLQAFPRLQFGGSHYMAVWVDVRARPEDYYPSDKADIYGALVSSTGSVTPTDGILVSTAPASPVAVLASQIVISGNNLNARVHLDGSGSYDPSGFPLTYLWFLDGSSTTLGSSASLDLSLPLGAHSVVLEVNNGYSSSEAQASVDVITASEATLALLRKIEQAGLRANLRAALEPQLRVASRHFSQGLFHPGDMLLQDFQKHASSLLKGINPSLAAELIADAQRIRGAIGGS